MPPFKAKKPKGKKKSKNSKGAVDKYYGEEVNEAEVAASKKRLRAPFGASRLEPYKKVKKKAAPKPEAESAQSIDFDDDDDDVSVELPTSTPSLDFLTKNSSKPILSSDEEDDEDDSSSDDDDDDDDDSDDEEDKTEAPVHPPHQPNPFLHTLPISPPTLSKSSSTTSKSQTSILSPSPPSSSLSYAVSSFADVLVTGGKRQNEDAVIDHVLSHVNNVITVKSKNDKKADSDNPPDNLRDQGYFRNTVLVLLPTRGVALDYVNLLLSKADSNHGTPMESFALNYDRFEKEFGVDASEVEEAEVKKARSKGKQYMRFLGPYVNTDDDFKLGISLSPSFHDSISKIAKTGSSQTTKSSSFPIRLYSSFENSDIIIASPLGLKLLFEKDTDNIGPLLSSLNIIHIPYADIIYMQNWSMVNEVLALANMTPSSGPSSLSEIDFSRVYNWVLDREDIDDAKGKRLARQLIISSAFINAEISSTFTTNGISLAGSYKTKLVTSSGAVSDVDVNVQQVFQRVQCDDFKMATKQKLDYFRHNVLKTILSRKSTNNLIYIPSYFDFIKIRNLLLKLEVPHVVVSEYARWSEIQRGRSRFFHGQKPIMLYTGRAHFFRRLRIRGVRNLTFFSLPQYPWVYSDIVNWVERGEGVGGEMSCISLFTKFEQFQLERIMGKENAMVVRKKSDKDTFMF